MVALRTSKLSKNCASRGLVGPFRRAVRAEKGPPGLQGGGGGAAAPAALPWLRACCSMTNSNSMSTICFADRPIALHAPRGGGSEFCSCVETVLTIGRSQLKKGVVQVGAACYSGQTAETTTSTPIWTSAAAGALRRTSLLCTSTPFFNWEWPIVNIVSTQDRTRSPSSCCVQSDWSIWKINRRHRIWIRHWAEVQHFAGRIAHLQNNSTFVLKRGRHRVRWGKTPQNALHFA